MNKEILLTGSRIRLRPLTESDLSLKVQWYNDPQIRRTLILDETLELQKTIEWFRSAQLSSSRLDLVIETPNGEAIGLAGLVAIDTDRRDAEIYIVIGERDYWARGVMLQAEALLLEHAFTQLQLQKVWAQAYADNIGSIVTMKKLGFQIELPPDADSGHDPQTRQVLRLEVDKQQFKFPEKNG